MFSEAMGKMGKKSQKPKKSRGSKKAGEGPKVELLEEDGAGDATRKFKQVLVEIFNRFDVDKDMVLNVAELKAFSRAANEDGREFTEEELSEMEEMFDWRDPADGKEGGLTLRGWLQMYVTQSGASPEETWRDLQCLGYNGQLDPRYRAGNKDLQAKLERLLQLGQAGDLDAFVDAFVMPDVEQDDRQDFLSRLRGGDSDTEPMLPNLLAELHCCANGDGVFDVQGCRGKGPVAFHFKSPTKGLERIDREVAFVLVSGDWYAEG